MGSSLDNRHDLDHVIIDLSGGAIERGNEGERCHICKSAKQANRFLSNLHPPHTPPSGTSASPSRQVIAPVSLLFCFLRQRGARVWILDIDRATGRCAGARDRSHHLPIATGYAAAQRKSGSVVGRWKVRRNTSGCIRGAKTFVTPLHPPYATPRTHLPQRKKIACSKPIARSSTTRFCSTAFYPPVPRSPLADSSSQTRNVVFLSAQGDKMLFVGSN